MLMIFIWKVFSSRSSLVHLVPGSHSLIEGENFEQFTSINFPLGLSLQKGEPEPVLSVVTFAYWLLTQEEVNFHNFMTL